jgi:hypothetical protein
VWVLCDFMSFHKDVIHEIILSEKCYVCPVLNYFGSGGYLKCSGV